MFCCLWMQTQWHQGSSSQAQILFCLHGKFCRKGKACHSIGRNAIGSFISSLTAAPVCPRPSCCSLALPQNTFLCWVQCLCSNGDSLQLPMSVLHLLYIAFLILYLKLPLGMCHSKQGCRSLSGVSQLCSTAINKAMLISTIWGFGPHSSVFYHMENLWKKMMCQ